MGNVRNQFLATVAGNCEMKNDFELGIQVRNSVLFSSTYSKLVHNCLWNISRLDGSSIDIVQKWKLSVAIRCCYQGWSRLDCLGYRSRWASRHRCWWMDGRSFWTKKFIAVNGHSTNGMLKNYSWIHPLSWSWSKFWKCFFNSRSSK